MSIIETASELKVSRLLTCCARPPKGKIIMAVKTLKKT
jgi:hypothetical protein